MNSQDTNKTTNIKENNNNNKNPIIDNKVNSSFEKPRKDCKYSTNFKYINDNNDFTFVPIDKKPYFNPETIPEAILKSRIYKDKLLKENPYFNLININQLLKFYNYYIKYHKYYDRVKYANKIIAFSNYNSYLAHCIIYPYFADSLFVYDDFYIDSQTHKLI